MIFTKRSHAPLSLAALLLFLLAAPGMAQAQAPDKDEAEAVAKAQSEAVDKVLLAQAEEHYKAAEVLYRLGKFAEALEQYKAAYKLIRSPNLLFNMAQAYRMLGQVDDALFHFRSYRDDYRRDNDDRLPPNIEEVERLIIQLKAKKVIEQEKKRQAEALAKEKELAKERLAREEKLRKEQLAREDMHRTDLKEIIKEQVGSAKKTPPQGFLLISRLDVDGAQVIVDSVPRAVAPVIKPIPLKPGKYRLQVKARGYLEFVTAIEIKDREDTAVSVTLQPVPKKSRLWLAGTITCFLLAAGAEAMAVFYTFEADSKYKGSPANADAKTMMYVGHGVAGGLGAMGITSLVLYLLSDKVEEPPPTSLGFFPVRGGAAVTGGFRF